MRNALQKPQSWAFLTAVLFVLTIIVVYTYTTKTRPNPCDATIAAAGAPQPPIDSGGVKHGTVIAVQPHADATKDKLQMHENDVGFGVPICVVVAGLPKEPERGQLFLLLNGQRMQKIVGNVVDQDRGLVLFTLDRTPEDRNAWQNAIGYPDIHGAIEMSVGVAAEKGGEYPRNSPPVSEAAPTIRFRLFEPLAMVTGAAALLSAVVFLVLLARTTGILRDGDALSSYSLARCQMAWWLYLITAAFLYIWFVTGDYNGVITPSSLVLLGISATTALAAVTIDTPAANPAGAAPPPRPAPPPSKSFLEDLLYESGSPTIHRVQILAWTVILGLVLMWEVYARFSFPQFDTNLLIMMGISGGFYLGFKAKEQ